MTRLAVAASLAALTLGVSACGGYAGPSSINPGTPTDLPPGTVTINIVGVDGSRSFSPNPAELPVGQTVVWHNVDGTTHRVVLDDGRLDTGYLRAGAYSGPMTLGAPGPYHCSIHPVMVGSIALLR